MHSQTLLVPTLRISSPLSPLSVPSICISPAADVDTHPDTPILEPTSPEAQSPRSVHLLPPPVRSPLRHSLVPSAKVADKKGLDQSTFEGLLNATRERAAKRAVSPADRLRREVVVKAHHSKQFERRALFLSKIAAPPSPTSAETAVTPPESPAVFHFTLPSPGLASPLELFETVQSRDSWIEHVDYATNCTKRMPSRLPSLDQITARLRPAVVLESPKPVVVQRLDEVKPRAFRLPDSIRASTRARSTSPPTPTIVVTPTPPVPIVVVTPTPAPVQPAPAVTSPPAPPKKPVLVPQSIPALRINKVPAKDLAPVPVMSWRDRAAPTPRNDSPAPAPVPRKESLEAWREMSSWREVRKDVPATLPLSIKSKSTVTKVLPKPVELTESERRAAQGRNMLDKLRRRISAPAQLQGTMKLGVPVGGF